MDKFIPDEENDIIVEALLVNIYLRLGFVTLDRLSRRREHCCLL